jgi:DNA (cytosine-5)-methyltransferase 1
MRHQKKVNTLSLFANVGIAETYLKDIGVDVVVANEIDPKRVNFYKHLYPDTNMIEGDITDINIKQQIIDNAKEKNVELILATPPCQGMSTAGKMDKWDVRNTLVCHAVDIVKAIKPKYVFLENVPQQLTTKILYDGKIMHIPEYVKQELEGEYVFNDNYVIKASEYGVPQFRERAIMLLVRKDVGKQWDFPEKTGTVTLEEAIGNLPSLDPEIYDIPYDEMIRIFPDFEKKKAAGAAVSQWHYPPKHVKRQVISMMHTPTGATAFDNIEKYQPRKKNGQLVTGFRNTYKRQQWDRPGTTVTMYSREISSQGNVHPGRYLGVDDEGYGIYSDARVMSIYELMIMSSLPKDWNIPEGVSDHFIRCVIGEGIPPLLVKKIVEKMMVIENE